MINYLIIAYDKKTEDGNLMDATEINVYADNAAEALVKAKTMFIAKNYMIRKVVEYAERDMYPNALMEFIQKQVEKGL